MMILQFLCEMRAQHRDERVGGCLDNAKIWVDFIFNLQSIHALSRTRYLQHGLGPNGYPMMSISHYIVVLTSVDEKGRALLVTACWRISYRRVGGPHRKQFSFWTPTGGLGLSWQYVTMEQEREGRLCLYVDHRAI